MQKVVSVLKSKYFSWDILAAAFIFLIFKFNTYRDKNFGQLFTSLLSEGNKGYFLTAFFLTFLNYSIESLKWQKLLSCLQKTSWLSAFQSVLTGICTSIFTPNRSGEVVGKVLYLDTNEKMKAALLNFSGGMAQMICTFIAGIWGLLLYTQYLSNGSMVLPYPEIIFAFAIIGTVLAFVVYFNQHLFFNWLSQKRWAQKLELRFTKAQEVTRITLLQVLLLSMSRYLVFSGQLVLLLLFCQIDAGIGILFLLSCIFFLLVWFLPSFALLELGIRGSVAYFVFQAVSADLEKALLSVVLLWIINVAFPALVGCYFVFVSTQKKKNKS